MLHVVLLEPEIPANTGNIGRTCVATGTKLHLVGPLGFRLNEKALARAGLDYWDALDVAVYADFADFLGRNPGARLYPATTKAARVYSDVDYLPDAFLLFGKESAGLPEEILARYADTCVRIPMQGEFRSLNLSNAVAIVLYEALRKQGFPGMKQAGGKLGRSWNIQPVTPPPQSPRFSPPG
ncbi:MAG: tRNA (cytidine(34)-2'-O)-methyltransferase [Lachnospiraceae bacterium]|jgi:tRNA (cytidine/uridine-2'-O-)-methyltransferase|nr:tRNA (cytidine(34)-2'-O)-methyltransferase [Lachnospiraceae bacterium]